MSSYKVWLNKNIFDLDTVKRVESMTDEEMNNAFSGNLEFGTAGLRGVMDAGTNRMNIYTVKRAAIAIAKWVNLKADGDKIVVIGYDIRHNSKEFAKITAEVMAYFGIRYILFNTILATPQLAYAVRYYNAFCGIMVTASHNPREYNGYKVYGRFGSQILEDDAEIIESYMSNISFDSLNEYNSQCDLNINDSKDLLDAYINDVMGLSIYEYDRPSLKVVYSPYNGCGLYAAKKIMDAKGYEYYIPEKQELPDPDFTTIPYPNPEVESTFEEAIKLADEKGVDLIVVNDPDADRINIAIRKNNKFEILTGNKLGALLTYYIVRRRQDLNMSTNGRFVKTIVSDEFAFDIAKEYGYNCSESLTGFKNISKFANMLDGKKEEFVFGYEESIGYEISSLVRDKDGLSALLYVLDMLEYFNNEGKTLGQVLDGLSSRYGYHCENNFSIYFEGVTGKSLMDMIMSKIRKGEVDGNFEFKIQDKIDFSKHQDKNLQTNSIKYFFEKNLTLSIRPSGTEPKMKFYIYGKSNNYDECIKDTKTIESNVRGLIELLSHELY